MDGTRTVMHQEALLTVDNSYYHRSISEPGVLFMIIATGDTEKTAVIIPKDRII
jgi:hypothetical protein